MTRGIAAGGALTTAVITMVLAQGPASASTASTTTDPGTTAQSGGPGLQGMLPDGQQNGDQALQPPMVTPSHSHGGSSHTRSGAS